MATTYTKEKMDVVIDNVTYKNIDVTISTNWEKIKEYRIDTTGVAQIIKQFVKNNYGDIKVWAKSSKFANGSSVGVNLWNVPNEWYGDIKEFADKFGKYIDYSSGDPDGSFYGKNVNATLIDGTSVGNSSPYMGVTNKPPYDSKEYDMPSPNYAEKPTPKKKEYERKGGKYSPTDNLDLVLDCGNGWKIYVGKPKEKYLYNVVKDKDTKQNKEQWAEIKADMLEAGFQWGYKSGTFQRWTTTPDDTLPQQACNVLSKYWGGSSQPKEETPQEPKILLPQGTEFELIEADSIFTKGETGVLAVDYYGGTYVEAYMNSEARPDYSHSIRFGKIRVIEEAPREETPKAENTFKVGDKVKYIGADKEYIKNGDIGKIVKYIEDKLGDLIAVENSKWLLPISEFELVKETPKENGKYKVGDKVRLIKDIDKIYPSSNTELGDIGTIIKIPKVGMGMYYDVEFNGKEIYLGNTYLELAQLKKEFKVGDKVRLVKEKQDAKIGDIGIVKIIKGEKKGIKNYYGVEFNDKEIALTGDAIELVEEEILPFVKGETIQLKKEFKYDNSTYPKGLRGEIKNIDYVFKTAYVYFYGDNSGNYPVPFEYLEKFVYTDETPKEVAKFKVGDKVRYIGIDESYIKNGDIGTITTDGGDNLYDIKFPLWSLYIPASKIELVKDENPKEVNLDEYLNDLNVLLEIEDNETKRLELATYISDLNTLKLLQ